MELYRAGIWREGELFGKSLFSRPAQPQCSHKTHTPPAAATAIHRDGRSLFFVINKRQCLLKNKRHHKTNKMIHWDFRTHLQTQQEGKSLPLPILAAEWDRPKKKHVPTVDSLSLFCQTLRFKWPFFFGTRILAAWRMLVLNNSNTSFFLVPHRVNNANSVSGTWWGWAADLDAETDQTLVREWIALIYL